MRPSRRRFLRTGAIAVPALACAAFAPTAARAAGDAGPGAFDARRRSILPGPAPTDPAACPFCQPGNPCPAHALQ